MEQYSITSEHVHSVTLATNGYEVTQSVETFKREQGISTLIAICGGAEMQATQTKELLNDTVKKLAFFPQVAIITGGTRGGVPEMATKLARQIGMKVIGVVPACVKPHNLLEEVDMRLTVDPLGYESVWGSESSLLTNLADAMIFIGGGAGTLIEMAQALKVNSSRLQPPKPGREAVYSRRPIAIAPVSGFGGVADLAPVFLAIALINQTIWERTFPSTPLRTGIDVANYLIRYLNLYETID